MIKKLNLDSIELRRKVKKLKLMHSIASQKTFLSNAIKPAYGRDRIKFKPIHECVQSYAISFNHSVINQWNKLPVAMLNVDVAKVRIYVCMYVCMYVCLFVCMYVLCIYVFMYV